jgi:hypothetical protein
MPVQEERINKKTKLQSIIFLIKKRLLKNTKKKERCKSLIINQIY